MLLPTKKKKALDHTRHCCSHIQKRPQKKVQKIQTQAWINANTMHHRDPCLFTVLPESYEDHQQCTMHAPTCTKMYQHAPCTTIVPFFRQCLGHRQLFQGILQQRLVFRHLPRAPFAPDQHFSHLVQQFGVFAFGHGRGHFRRRSRLHGFVVPGKRTGSVHRSINRAKKQQKQQKQQRLRRTLAGLPSRPPPRRRVCAGKKSRSVYILNRTKGLVNQSSSTNHRQPIIINQSTNQPIIVKTIILKTIIVNQSTNHRQTINQSPSNHHRHTTTSHHHRHHRHTYLCHRPYFQHLFTPVVLVLHQDHAGFKHHQFRVQVFQPSGVPEKSVKSKKTLVLFYTRPCIYT